MAKRKSESVFGGLDPAIYQPGLSRGIFTEKEARREYSRLRRVANRRLERLERAGYGNSAVMRRYGQGFESMRGTSEAAIRERLGDVAAFLERKTSSVTGQRAAVRSFVETMQERGYGFITTKNAAQFGRFMEAAKKHYGNAKAFDSEQIIDMFEEVIKSEADPDIVSENFEYWSEHMDELQAPEPEPGDYEYDYTPVKSGGKRSLTPQQRETRRVKGMKTRAAKAQQKGGRRRR